MITSFNATDFNKTLDNFIEYSFGFLEGVEKGKSKFLDNLGDAIEKSLKDFIDSNARVQPRSLHHVYEWNRTGNADARLFDINHTVNGNTLRITQTFRQSTSVQTGSSVPFFDKAEIMENGTPVTIRPRNGSVLRFMDGSDVVFTKKAVVVRDPGGREVQGSLERTIKMFFESYFGQSFMELSGIRKYLQTPTMYKQNIRGGDKIKGIIIGEKWIEGAGLLDV